MNRAWLVWEEAAEDGRFRQYADLKEDERAARSLAMSLLASFGAGWDRAFSIRFDPPPLSPDRSSPFYFPLSPGFGAGYTPAPGGTPSA